MIFSLRWSGKIFMQTFVARALGVLLLVAAALKLAWRQRGSLLSPEDGGARQR
jgi:hypothetical protein